VRILNSISGKAWYITSLFIGHFTSRVLAISQHVQSESLDNAIITPQPVTTLLQQHIMSTLCKIEPILLELHLAVGSEMRVKLSLCRA